MLIRRVIFVAMLAIAFASPSALAWGGYKQLSNCEQSANSMLRACHYDVRDDLNETIASCQHISDQGDRWSCYISAYGAKSEDSEECRDVHEARYEACDLLDEDRYDPDPLLVGEFVDLSENPEIWVDYQPNPYVSVEPGHTYVLRAGDDEEEELVVVHVTEDTQEVQNVACRIVVDIVFEVSEEDGEVEYELVEATDDLFAINTLGDVVYCGEVSRNYEDGILRDLDGSFESGLEWAKAGYLIKAMPNPPYAHRQEFLPGEAEDIVQYISFSGDPEDEGVDGAENFPCNSGCLQTRDSAPLDPGDSEYKYYLPPPGPGFVFAIALDEDGPTGEREELLCVGEDLSILADPQCGFGDNHETVMEELCKVSPDAFCVEEEDD